MATSFAFVQCLERKRLLQRVLNIYDTVGGSSPILSLAISENGPFIAAGTEYTQLKGKEGDASVLIWYVEIMFH